MIGTWYLVKQVDAFEEVPSDREQELVYEFTNERKLRLGRAFFGESDKEGDRWPGTAATFAIDASSEPARLTFIMPADLGISRRQEAIIKIEDDLLYVAVAAVGESRPQQFRPSDGEFRYLRIFSRMPPCDMDASDSY